MSVLNIVGDFYPIFLVFQATGLIYFDPKESQKKRPNTSKHPTTFFRIYFFSLLLALCGLSAFTVWVFLFKDRREDEEQEYVMDKFVVSSILVGTFVASYSTIIESFCTWHKHIRFFEKMSEIDSHLSVVAPDQKFPHIHRYISLRVLSSFLVIFGIHSVQIYLAFSTDFQLETANFWMAAGIPVLLIALTICKYLLYLLMIQVRMKIISNILEKILDESGPKLDFLDVKEVKSESSILLTMDKVSSLRKGSLPHLRIILDIFLIITFALVFSLLSDSTCLVNGCFGITMVILVTLIFTAVTYNAYMAFVHYQQNDDITVLIGKFSTQFI